MSLFLRSACVRCLVRRIYDVKRFYWTNRGFALPEDLRIRYFIPRTSDAGDVRVRPGQVSLQGLQSQGDFKMIYRFQVEGFLQGISYSAFTFLLMIIYFIFNTDMLQNSKSEDENQKTEKEELTLENDYVFSEEAKKTDIKEAKFFRSAYAADPKAKLAIALTMVIIFFCIRARVVLTIYRNCDDFVTVFYKPLGINKKLIKHKAEDCCYHANRKILNHSLLGKYVILFPECFVSQEEEEFYVGRKMPGDTFS